MKKDLLESLKNWWSQLVNEIVEAVNLQQSKFLLKVTSFAFFIFFFVSVKAQAENVNQFVTLNETNSSIEKIILEIRSQTGYDFLYNARLMRDTKPVTIVVKNEYFKKVLEVALSSPTKPLPEEAPVAQDVVAKPTGAATDPVIKH